MALELVFAAVSVFYLCTAVVVGAGGPATLAGQGARATCGPGEELVLKPYPSFRSIYGGGEASREAAAPRAWWRCGDYQTLRGSSAGTPRPVWLLPYFLGYLVTLASWLLAAAYLACRQVWRLVRLSDRRSEPYFPVSW